MAQKDGGPAFPQCLIETRDGAIQASYDAADGAGLSLRDYFAAKALPFALSSSTDHDGCYDYVAASVAAYMIADAMIAERDDKQP
jgi:hypothetical protein